MSRRIPEHPPKGSAEAYAWAERMRAARQKKARLKYTIRQAGLKTEQEFFGPGGPLAPKALQKRKLNPFASRPQPKKQFHILDLETYSYVASFPTQVKAVRAYQQALRQGAPAQRYQVVDEYGVERYQNPGATWHEGMAQVAQRYRKDARTQTEKHLYAGMEVAHRDSALAARKLGMNPRRRTKKNPIAVFNPAPVAGTIYNNAIEIKAQKTGGPLKGHYKHVFGKNVKILGLKDGTVLLKHAEGKPLWITRKDYERSGRKHD